jgi:hypothetical protein
VYPFLSTTSQNYPPEVICGLLDAWGKCQGSPFCPTRKLYPPPPNVGYTDHTFKIQIYLLAHAILRAFLHSTYTDGSA